MSGDDDTMEWETHASGDTTDSFDFSPDGRTPVYRSKGQYYTCQYVS